MDPFVELAGRDLRMRVRLTPNARAEAFGGLHEDGDGVCWLKASVRAVPEKGKANAALVALVSKASGIAKGRIEVTSGATSRAKVLRIANIGAAEIAAIEALAKG
jgi:uncharacterized protein YggU (UPF0235/DUF167 family)